MLIGEDGFPEFQEEKDIRYKVYGMLADRIHQNIYFLASYLIGDVKKQQLLMDDKNYTRGIIYNILDAWDAAENDLRTWQHIKSILLFLGETKTVEEIEKEFSGKSTRIKKSLQQKKSPWT